MVHDTNVGKKTLQRVLGMVHDTNVGKKTLQRVLGMVHDTNVGKKLCRGYWEWYMIQMLGKNFAEGTGNGT